MEKLDANNPLQQTETKFHSLLESLPDPVIIVDGDLCIRIVNRQFETIFGYDRSEVIGRSVEMLIPERFPPHRDYLRGYQLNPATRFMRHTREVFALRKDGGGFPVDIHLSPIEMAEGTAVVATIRDISTQKQNEAQLEYQANHDRLTGLPNRNCWKIGPA